MAIVRRVSQEVVEALVQDTNPTRRISQVAVEALVQDTNPIRRISQVAVEALVQDTNPIRRISQVAVEVLFALPVAEADLNAQVTPDQRAARLVGVKIY
jgi:hypothetical protein